MSSPQLDHDVAVRVETPRRARWNQVRRGVLLDDRRPLLDVGEIGAAKDRCPAPSVLGPEVHLAPGGFPGWRRLVAIDHDAIRHSRPVRNPLGHAAEAAELYGLVGAGAAAVHALVIASHGPL